MKDLIDRVLNAPADRDVMRQALDLLEILFDAYENGVPCYEKPDEEADFVGYAFKLEESTFHACCTLLNKERPRDAAPTPPAEQPAEPDQQLCRFYQAQTFPELVSAMERHIERLQAKLPRGEQPAFTRVREG